ncbi:MAG: response regulator transcription factor [Nitrospirota bacterium]|nr:response regulator transcription factor [Nitrospirota bacterium]
MGLTILVVEDEKDLSELLEYNLRKEGYAVVTARSGAEGLRMAVETEPDLVILDLMLPDIFGIDVCRTIRENDDTASVPIIMLTAKSQTADKVEGLSAGADDYLTKPFSPKELIARIKAVLRRSGRGIKKTSGRKFKCDHFSIDFESCRVLVEGKPVELTATEYKLLTCLVESNGRVLSREHLLDAVWREDAFVEPRTVDVHIRHLRTRIEHDPAHPEFIKTVRGLGYRFETGNFAKTEGD